DHDLRAAAGLDAHLTGEVVHRHVRARERVPLGLLRGCGRRRGRGEDDADGEAGARGKRVHGRPPELAGSLWCPLPLYDLARPPVSLPWPLRAWAKARARAGERLGGPDVWIGAPAPRVGMRLTPPARPRAGTRRPRRRPARGAAARRAARRRPTRPRPRLRARTARA